MSANKQFKSKFKNERSYSNPYVGDKTDPYPGPRLERGGRTVPTTPASEHQAS